MAAISGVRVTPALREAVCPVGVATPAKEKHGREFAASEIDVIGDTPRDIACGKALGARTIAVATGRWGRDDLARHHPDFLIDDLSNVETIVDTLGW